MNRFFQIGLLLIWTGFIVFSLVSEPIGNKNLKILNFKGIDKVVHAILFGIEAFLIAWLCNKHLFKNTFFVLTLFWVLILGGALEMVQHFFIIGRNGDWFDLLADILGAVVFLLGFREIKRRFYGIN